MNHSFNKFLPGPIQKINLNWGHPDLFIKRLDLVQSWADGNKYYKLKYNISFALENGIKSIVSKGGMFSNHLHSLAHACSAFGIKLTAVVRSYGPDPGNPLMNELKGLSHEILYLQPKEYQLFNESDARNLYPDSMFIPEGGMNAQAIEGAKEIIEECSEFQPTHVIISGGTLTTACGLLAAGPKSMKIIIVPGWNGCTPDYVEEILLKYGIKPECDWEIWPDSHFGGFAKYDHRLVEFMNSFTRETGIPLDPVYTGKMMYAISEKMKSGYFSKDDSIIAIHTGGLQGIRGFAYRYTEDWSSYEELVFNQK